MSAEDDAVWEQIVREAGAQDHVRLVKAARASVSASEVISDLRDQLAAAQAAEAHWRAAYDELLDWVNRHRVYTRPPDEVLIEKIFEWFRKRRTK